MRKIFEFISRMALGVILAVIVAAVVAGDGARLPAGHGQGGVTLHFGSLVLGLVLGHTLCELGRVGWRELPRRMAAWLRAHEMKFYWLAWAGVFGGILIFY